MKYEKQLQKLDAKICKAINNDQKKNGGANVGALNSQREIVEWAFGSRSIDFAINACKQDIERTFRYTTEAEKKIEALEAIQKELLKIKSSAQ
ncbi:hypothetical protein [Runella salmonicolor]|uniref:Uncharacterized protein n=1 Tax=Runella salmonicolor TaxID=2950278 RepID=A0ABT1FUI7_9BACT|nr:hypothetical protein [Runella salmonicolor]MCP1384448.1 hypothetical protein [Runella salmonicolor]